MFHFHQPSTFNQVLSSILLVAFFRNTAWTIPSYAQENFFLPKPGQMVHLSESFKPVVMRGIKLDPAHPFRFNFLIDEGDTNLNGRDFKDEAQKVIKYFLTSLAIPDHDLWVNLSPYEKKRIIPQEFGKTQMGRDLLAQDYILKQITSSLIYPEKELGKKFWERVYKLAQEKYGSTNIPIKTFNKVWIVPDHAVVYEHQGTAFVLNYHLKVMLEQDYFALDKNKIDKPDKKEVSTFSSDTVRSIVLPELEKEVNSGKNFSSLRQIFYSLILATWYKTKVKQAILNQVYSDKEKVFGVLVDDPQVKEKIYQQYLKSFKKGVFNYIKEDLNTVTNEEVPRKYFSGGVLGHIDQAAIAYVPQVQSGALSGVRLKRVSGDVRLLQGKQPDYAMNSQAPKRLTIAESRRRLLKSLISMKLLYPVLQKTSAEGLEVFKTEGIDAFESKSYPRIKRAADAIKVEVDAITSLPSVLGFWEPEMRDKLDTFLKQVAEEAHVDKVLILFGRGEFDRFCYTYGFSNEELFNFNLNRDKIMGMISKIFKPRSDRDLNEGLIALKGSGILSALQASPDTERWVHKDGAYIRIVIGRSEQQVSMSGELTEQDRKALVDKLNAFIANGQAPWYGVRKFLEDNQYKDFSDFMMILRHNGGVVVFRVSTFPFIYETIPYYLEKIRAKDSESQKWHDEFISRMDHLAKASRIYDEVETFLQLLAKGTDFKSRNVTPYIRQRVASFKAMAQAKGLNFIADLSDEDLVVCVCDLNLMDIVVDELIKNAIKYTSTGTVNVRLVKKTMRARYRNEDQESAVFEVEDTGIGIPPDEKAEIFSRGYRATNANSIQGTGIGLDAVNFIVRLMRGDITVESEVGKGSKFIVRLPIAPVPDKKEKGDDKAQVSNTGGIDLTSKRYKISIENDGREFKMDFDPAMVRNLQFDGVEFKINRIDSVINPQSFLSGFS